MITVDDLKTYLRVDGTAEDALLASLLAAATSYIDKQTGKTQVKTSVDASGAPVYAAISTSELYNTCVKLMVAHWYENRGVEIAGSLTRITHSVDALVQHISMCGDYV